MWQILCTNAFACARVWNFFKLIPITFAVCIYISLSLTMCCLFGDKQLSTFMAFFSLLKIDYNCVSQCTFISINQRLNLFFFACWHKFSFFVAVELVIVRVRMILIWHGALIKRILLLYAANPSSSNRRH